MESFDLVHGLLHPSWRQNKLPQYHQLQCTKNRHFNSIEGAHESTAPNRIRISVMPVMRKRQFGTWLNQPVVTSTSDPAKTIIQQTFVKKEERNELEWTISGLRCNIERCTTGLATIYREEYNCGTLESSPTLSAMTALSYTSGRTVPIPTDFEDNDFLRGMTACADLPNHRNASILASDERASSESQLNPPASHPHVKRRSPQDLYAPTTIRGAGYLKEGMCPLCSTPAWFKIKQSAYWYHMNFTHGISAMTGLPYEMPSQYQRKPICMDAEIRHQSAPPKCEDIQVEGLCGRCCEWISIIVIPKHMCGLPINTLNHSVWFKHAQKCHQRAPHKRVKVSKS